MNMSKYSFGAFWVFQPFQATLPNSVRFIEFNEILLFEDLALFNLKLAEYLALYNSKRLHKALALTTPVEYILKENKNCNMWWTHTQQTHRPPRLGRYVGWLVQTSGYG